MRNPPPYVCEANLPIWSICVKSSVPAAKDTFPDSRLSPQFARGNPRRVIPEGRHSAPVPENALRAPVAPSVSVHSRGRYAMAVPFKVRIRDCRYQYQCCAYENSTERTKLLSPVFHPLSTSKKTSLFGITPLSCPTAPPAVRAPQRCERPVMPPENFPARIPARS